nr:cysteine synthase A [Planomicrobium sp. YIM 101495]
MVQPLFEKGRKNFVKPVHSIIDLIGNTPVVKLQKLVPEQAAEVFVKLEMFNPSKSVKDRAAANMIAEAEKHGRLNPSSTIIEPTSGNTGIGLAMVAAAKGYRAILVMPDNATSERVNLLKAFGAEVVLTPADEKMPGAIKKAEELAKEIPDSFIPQQFENAANPDIHRTTTAVEIIEQMNGELDAFIATAGTGGTITGTGETLKAHWPDLKIVVVEPKGSPVLSGGKPGKHKLVGTSPGFVPSILNTDVYDEILQISDNIAIDMFRRLARNEGIFVGPSAAAAVYTAIETAKQLGAGKKVLCIAPDTGERYLSMGLIE